MYMRKFVFFIVSVIVLSCAGADSTEKYITEHYAMEGSSVEIVEIGKPFRIDFGDFENHVRSMSSVSLMITNATFPEDTLTKAQRDSTLDNAISIADSIADTVSLDLLGRLLSSQLVSKSDRSLLDTNRTYYKLLRKIAIEGKDKGVFRDELSANDIIKAYAVLERALLYDWCICSGDYSLCSYAGQVMPTLLKGFCK